MSTWRSRSNIFFLVKTIWRILLILVAAQLHPIQITYTGYIVGACIFIAVTITGIIIKIKCEGASQLFEFINAFK